MPTKITERDVCRKVVERNSEMLQELRARGKQYMPYTKPSFRSDMRSEGFLATTSVIDSKWDMLKADEIVVVDGVHSALDMPRLYLSAGLHVPMPRGGCVRDREIERETKEGGQ